MKLTKTPYVYWIVIIAALYLGITVYVSEFYVTIRYIPVFLSTINWLELTASIILTLIIATLVGINSVYSYVRYTQRRSVKREATASCAATLGGIATGVCPACVTSVFPFIFGIFGITFSWTFLPLKGFEIQVIIITILLGSLYFLRKDFVNKIIFFMVLY
jgi:Na+/H+-translocating membrane pyrophosphatase